MSSYSSSSGAGDSLVAASSHEKGKPNPAQEACSDFDLDICPDLLLAGIAAAAAAAFALLYTAITMAQRRKRRSLNPPLRSAALFTEAIWLGSSSRSNDPRSLSAYCRDPGVKKRRESVSSSRCT